MLYYLSTQLVEKVLVRSFSKEMEIEFGQNGGERVGIDNGVSVTVVIRDSQSITECCFDVRQDTFKKPVIVLSLKFTRRILTPGIQDIDRLCFGGKASDDNPLRTFVPDGVHAQDFERVVMVCADDAIDVSVCGEGGTHGQAEMGGVSAIVRRPGWADLIAGTAFAMIAQVAVSPCVPPGTVIV